MRILHGADFHLDSPFRGLPPEKAKERRRESRDLLDRLSACANERQVDAVVLSGDLFDGEQVYRETLETLARALGQIRCPVLISPGNHDPYHSRSPYRQVDWPGNVHVFSSASISRVELERGVLYGAAFTAAEQGESLLAGFTAPPADKPQVMCLHADLRPGPYNPIAREEIAASGLDYLALGHIHQRRTFREGGTFCAYPGCPEGRGFDELGEKGVLLAEVEPGAVQTEFIPLCRRRYSIVEADVTGRDPRERMEAVAELFPAGDILRVLFTGESDAAGVDLDGLQTAFGPRFYHLELQDHTRPGEDLWSRAGEDSLRGLFLRDLREQYEAAEDEEERQRIARAARLGLAALDGRDI